MPAESGRVEKWGGWAACGLGWKTASGERPSLLEDLKAARAKVDRFAAPTHPVSVRVERIENEPALLVVLHQLALAQHAQVVRDVDDFSVEQLGQLADVFRPAAQVVEDLQAVEVSDRLQQL